MLARAPIAAAVLAIGLAAPALADHYPGHSGSIYGPRSGTGTNYYDRQPNSGSDPWNQPRRPTLEHQWEQPRGTNPWDQPRKPDLTPWGKPKY
ncbi:MAG: hypothetical protein U1F37_06595 [Alphaproteobacteria bacterium]